MAYSWMKREWQLRRSFQSQWPGCPPSFLQVNTRGTPSLPTPAPPIPLRSPLCISRSLHLSLPVAHDDWISVADTLTAFLHLPPKSSDFRHSPRFSVPRRGSSSFHLLYRSLPSSLLRPSYASNLERARASWFCHEYATRRKVSRQFDFLFSFPSSLSFDSPFRFLFSLFLHLWYIRLHPLD